jgi:DNA-binding PadR family transcriptional regulator
MTDTYTAGEQGGYAPKFSADAMWEAMSHLRAQFDNSKVGTRMGRGDVRTAILALLLEAPMHGYQLIRAIEERTDGRWKPSAGSVYPTLQLLLDEGLVSAEMAQDRKTYSLTEAGEQVAAEAVLQTPWARAAAAEESTHGTVPKAGMELAQAAAQIARTGTAEQKQQAVELLDETRRKIYSILAQS